MGPIPLIRLPSNVDNKFWRVGSAVRPGLQWRSKVFDVYGAASEVGVVR